MGVFYGWRDGLAISKIVEDVHYGETGYAYIINKKGITVGHKKKELVIKQYNPIEDAKKNPDVLEFAQIIKEHMIKGEKGTGSYMFEKKEIIVGYAPVNNSPWVIAVSVENNEILKGVNQLRYSLIIFTMIIILAGIFTTYIIRGS